MKVIIAGSRDLIITPDELRDFFIDKNIQVTEVVSGKARGIDTCGEIFAKKFKIDIVEFPADWDKYGRRAGPLRNKDMARYGDILVLVWDGKSRGSANMKKEMEKLGKKVYEIIK